MDVLLKLDRYSVLFGIGFILVLVMCVGLGMRVMEEEALANSYALLAQAFLEGRFDVDTCVGLDCAVYQDRFYVVFPPFPAVVALPFVGVFGVHFASFLLIGVALFGLTGYVWWRIFRALELDHDAAAWLVLALMFATPLYYVTIRADLVWFFAQSIGFFLVTLALREVIESRRLVSAGICIGLALLTRQMAVFLLPFIFVLALEDDERLFKFNRAWFTKALKLCAPVFVCGLIYLWYNWVRFGDPLDTGYQYFLQGVMQLKEQGLLPEVAQASLYDPYYTINRIRDIGLFSPDYVLFNLYYLLVQGFHVDFGGSHALDLIGMDRNGTALLAASPFVLLMFFAPWCRETAIALLVIAVIAGVTLFYHSNGYTQYNVQRYVLDWLPVVFVLLAVAMSKERLQVFKLLAVYGVALNVAVLATLTLIV